DVETGKITNTARGCGMGPVAEICQTDTEETKLTRAPALTLLKSVDLNILNAGALATYTFTVTNTGNVVLTDLKIIETEFTGTGGMSAVTCDTTTLAPDAKAICTATYTLSASDVASTLVKNTAYATGLYAAKNQVVPSNEASASIPWTHNPELRLAKTGAMDAAASDPPVVGDKIIYSFSIVNTGDVTVTDIWVEDPLVVVGSCTVASGILLPGESMTCYGAYTITAKDLAAGKVVNTAIAHGKASDVDSNTSTWIQPLRHNPNIKTGGEVRFSWPFGPI
ncbi:MAG: DUF11 domain-containing protein, partial [Propionibacteriaceae bacterium]|nr:DUF11 domain-containing protein [Propionibacteriaceae bacterium]